MCIVLIIPGHSRREVPRQLWDIVNPGIQWRFIAPGHTHKDNMYLNNHYRVCLIFTHTILRTSKSINNTMKNATRYCAGPAYYRMCSPDVYCSKQTGSSSTKKENHHPSFLRFWIGQKKTVDAAKILWRRRKKCQQNRNPANIRKWIARFYYFRWHFPVKARVYCSQ